MAGWRFRRSPAAPGVTTARLAAAALGRIAQGAVVLALPVGMAAAERTRRAAAEPAQTVAAEPEPAVPVVIPRAAAELAAVDR